MHDDKLNQMEKELKQNMCEETEDRFIKHKVSLVTIDKQKDIIKSIFKLVERQKHANFR